MQLLSNSTAVAVLDPDLILRPSRMEVIFRNSELISNDLIRRSEDTNSNWESNIWKDI